MNNFKLFILGMATIFVGLYISTFFMKSDILDKDKNSCKEYALSTVVDYVDYNSDTVFVRDFNGNVWSFYGCDDWLVNDICSIIMNDNGTEIIYDDEIISVRYNGYID